MDYLKGAKIKLLQEKSGRKSTKDTIQNSSLFLNFGSNISKNQFN